MKNNFFVSRHFNNVVIYYVSIVKSHEVISGKILFSSGIKQMYQDFSFQTTIWKNYCS